MKIKQLASDLADSALVVTCAVLTIVALALGGCDMASTRITPASSQAERVTDDVSPATKNTHTVEIRIVPQETPNEINPDRSVPLPDRGGHVADHVQSERPKSRDE
jgi:hypothetical protein